MLKESCRNDTRRRTDEVGETAALQQEGHAVKILLVEDDLAHARIIQRALRSVLDLREVIHVTDGQMALDYVHGRGPYADRSAHPEPELIILDLRLPVLDGFEVLHVLKQDPLARHIPIVIFSTSDRSQDINRCYGSGANAFVTKPLDFGDFSRKIVDIYHFWNDTAEMPQ
jgi:CheY-like chemotaxis protein